MIVDPVAEIERLAGPEIAIADIRLEDFDFDRKERMAHQASQRVLEVEIRQQMTGPDAECVRAGKERREKGNPAYMVDVTMA